MFNRRFDARVHHRRSIRWRGHDYSQSGAYFITTCAQKQEHVFGRIVGGGMRLNAAGKIVEEEWGKCATIRSYIRLDAFVVMPNHFHGILWIVEDDPPVGAQRAVPLDDENRTAMPHNEKGHSTAMPLRPHRFAGFQHVIPGSLGVVIRAFKSASAKRINAMRGTPGASVWQRNYYERVLRGRDELPRARWYIEQNPAQWTLDQENPDRCGASDPWETFLCGTDSMAGKT